MHYTTVASYLRDGSDEREEPGESEHDATALASVDDAERRRLIPTAKHDLADLRDAFAEVLATRDEILFIEMTLIDGVNDCRTIIQKINVDVSGFAYVYKSTIDDHKEDFFRIPFHPLM